MDCQYESTIKDLLKRVQNLENKVKILEEDNLILTIQNGKLEQHLMNIDSHIYSNSIKERGVE